jgi:hypothetical protein
VSTQLALDLERERCRLSHQCEMILGRLQQGRVSNKELSGLSLKYTGRISDLRARRHVVKVVERDFASGLTWYALFVDGQEVGR